MPREKKKPTMTWENAPDTVGVEEIMAILGIGKNAAGDLLNEKDFPRIPHLGTSLRADKEAARLYVQGFKMKENSKLTMDYMILSELKKLNKLLEMRSEVTNEN